MTPKAPRSPAGALANATSTLVQPGDVTDTVAKILVDCREVLSAQAVGVLVRDVGGEFDLLGSTSHGVTEIEMFQIQRESGPCVDAIKNASAMSIIGADEIESRWPEVGRSIVEAGYQSVQAYPLRWHDDVFGAMNVFSVSATGPTVEQVEMGQAFANVLTIVVVQNSELTTAELSNRVRQALRGRTLIEQAKGVLAQTLNVDMAAAYDHLVQTAAAADETITEMAADLIRRRTAS